jgi:CRP-like cAMP-binding protein
MLDIAYLCSELQYEYFKAGEIVFHYGENGTKFYIIIKGKVAIMIPDPKKKAEHSAGHTSPTH